MSKNLQEKFLFLKLENNLNLKIYVFIGRSYNLCQKVKILFQGISVANSFAHSNRHALMAGILTSYQEAFLQKYSYLTNQG